VLINRRRIAVRISAQLLTLCASAVVLAGAALAPAVAGPPTIASKVRDLVIDETEMRAHAMRPPHIVGIRSDKGRAEGLTTIPGNFPHFNTQPHLDVDAFGKALHAALKDNVAGYAMELRQHGKTIYTLEWQWAKTPSDGSENWTPGRQMHLASVSKLLTAMAMTRLLDDKHISYDAKIIDYLPTYWKKGKGVNQITFRNLMTQTSGFDTTSDETDYEFMKAQVAKGASTVGTYNYLNMNFGLCRILLAIINGNIDKTENFLELPIEPDVIWDYVTIQAYKKYLTNHVFEPGGAEKATLTHPSDDALAYNFPVSGPGWNSGDLTSVAGGAGWHLTIDGLLNVMGTFRRKGTILPMNKAQGMLDAGFGIDVIQNTPLGTLYNKNGLWWDGSHVEQTLAYFLPDDMELAVFTNSPIGKPTKKSPTGEFFRDFVTKIYLNNIKG